jgi:hypothetical protein
MRHRVSEGPETPEAVLLRLEGFWCPTHINLNGQVFWEGGPDANQCALTVAEGVAHVTAGAEYYVTGGRLAVFPASGRLTIGFRGMAELAAEYVYRLDERGLELRSGGPLDLPEWVSRYVRIADRPPTDVAAFIDQIVRNSPVD